MRTRTLDSYSWSLETNSFFFSSSHLQWQRQSVPTGRWAGQRGRGVRARVPGEEGAGGGRDHQAADLVLVAEAECAGGGRCPAGWRRGWRGRRAAGKRRQGRRAGGCGACGGRSARRQWHGRHEEEEEEDKVEMRLHDFLSDGERNATVVYDMFARNYTCEGMCNANPTIQLWIYE